MVLYSEHPYFEKPEDENIKIWRYLDFTKFVSLLDKQALFFARSDELGDPFEGSFSKANVELRHKIYRDLAELEKFLRDFRTFSREMIRFTIINCWHINEYESSAMWKLYLKSNEGIAIQSTFKRLTECFDKSSEFSLHIGKVKYIDYNIDWLPEGNTFYPFLHKRISFEHERELRAIIQKVPSKNGRIDLTLKVFEHGAYIPVNLNILIEKIYVSPTSPDWFYGLTKSIIEKYELQKEVVRSSLADDPVY